MRKKRRKLGKGKLIALNQMPLKHDKNKNCPFSGEGAPKIDYKDARLLERFVSEQGKMTPSRITLVSQKKQRVLAREIKRSRFLALMPYLREDKPPKPRSEGFVPAEAVPVEAAPADAAPAEAVPVESAPAEPAPAEPAPVETAPEPVPFEDETREGEKT